MSTLVTSNVSDGTTTVGTEYVVNGSAKAWVNFNGTGTVAVRDSMNVASLTDVSSGVYKVNFSNNFATDEYSVTVGSANSSSNNNTGNSLGYGGVYSASQYGIAHFETATETDSATINNSVHGDLA